MLNVIWSENLFKKVGFTLGAASVRSYTQVVTYKCQVLKGEKKSSGCSHNFILWLFSKCCSLLSILNHVYTILPIWGTVLLSVR